MASSLPPTLEIVTAPNQVNELTKDAIDYIDTISDPILFDEMLREEDKRDKQAKCSEIFRFTIRKLSPDECVKFKLDSSKNYQIITSIETESVASVVGLKVGDVLIGVYNTNGQIRQWSTLLTRTHFIIFTVINYSIKGLYYTLVFACCDMFIKTSLILI